MHSLAHVRSIPSDDPDTEYSVFDDESDDGTETDRAAGGPESTGDQSAGRQSDGHPDALNDGDERGCPKCGHDGAETDTISTTGSGFSKFFDVQNRRFLVVSCEDCGYSELYRGQSRGNVIDFFLG